MSRYGRRGFTLVELLVVITIIGILISLLMPAVQSVREAGRRATCKNNLYQIGRAASQHYAKQQFYPTGGWGWRWAGDPDRGFTKNQPSGWCYNILPYLELENLHDMGKGCVDSEKRRLGRIATETTIAVYGCPTRRPPIAYPYIHTSPFFNIDRPTVIGRADYAMNAGSVQPGCPESGPSTIAEGDAKTDWGTVPKVSNGVSYVRSEISIIDDGDSNTYLVGERFIDPDGYAVGNLQDDDQGWNMGYDWDTLRWTDRAPLRDRAGLDGHLVFGSAHPAGWNVVFCDGSVRTMNYGIDLVTHSCLGSRNDHTPIDQSQL